MNGSHDSPPPRGGEGEHRLALRRHLRAWWWRYLALVIAVCVGLTIWVFLAFNSYWHSSPNPWPNAYSEQQLEHAASVIGGPPGFSAGQFGPYSDIGLAQYEREYKGSGTAAAVTSWSGSRLAALGFENIQGGGAAFCQRFVVHIMSVLPFSPGPVTEVQVMVQSDGVSNSYPACPAGLFG